MGPARPWPGSLTVFALGALRRRRSAFGFGGGPGNHITPLVNSVTKCICWNPYTTRLASHSAAVRALTWGDTPRGAIPDGDALSFPQVTALVNAATSAVFPLVSDLRG